MSVVENPIAAATTFETAIDIISQEDISIGVEALKWRYRNVVYCPANSSLSPVMQAGVLLGRDLASVYGQTMNPIRMSYYTSDGKRMESPQCKSELDIYKVVDFVSGITKSVTLVEAVVDTQGTLVAAMSKIRRQIDEVNAEYHVRFAYPEFNVFAILSKINGDTQIPNFNYAYKFHPDIWAFGYGCDADGRKRSIRDMHGYLSPFATRAPGLPYYSQSDLVQEFLRHAGSDLTLC